MLGFKMKSRAIIIATLLLMGLAYSSVMSRQDDNPQPSEVVIKWETHGGPCGSVCVDENDLSCCPAYSFSIAGDGTVNYQGLIGVKVRGKRVHSIPAKEVEELVEEFNKIDFFSLRDSYNDHTIDHNNAVTISLTVGRKTKSIYVFTGEPEALDKLMRKVYLISKVGQYVSRT
jgi:hypothetical protein